MRLSLKWSRRRDSNPATPSELLGFEDPVRVYEVRWRE